jgi:hypothetical protein
MTALVSALGTDRFESVRVLRNDAALLRAMPYDSIANARPITFLKKPQLPGSAALFQNFPNPFNPSTTIRYRLPVASHVTLTVYNTLGQLIAMRVNENEAAGVHDVKFDGSGLASGLYFYRLRAGSYSESKKFVIIR